MHQKGKLAKGLPHLREHFLNLPILGGIAGQDERVVQGSGQPGYPVFQAVVLIGKGQLRPGLPQQPGNGPSNAAVVGHAENQALFAGQVYRVQKLFPPGADVV